MSCFPVCFESLPQMSLQQDNAFKSPWKSTRPHTRSRCCHHKSGGSALHPEPGSARGEYAGPGGALVHTREDVGGGAAFTSSCCQPGSQNAGLSSLPMAPEAPCLPCTILGARARGIRGGASRRPAFPPGLERVLTIFHLVGYFRFSLCCGPESLEDQSREHSSVKKTI